MKISLMVVVAAGMLAACAGSPTSELEHIANSYLGYSASRLSGVLGEPSRVLEAGDNLIILTYLLRESSRMPNTLDPLTADPRIVQRSNLQKTCITTFTLKDDIVVSYQIDLDQCSTLTAPR